MLLADVVFDIAIKSDRIGSHTLIGLSVENQSAEHQNLPRRSSPGTILHTGLVVLHTALCWLQLIVTPLTWELLCLLLLITYPLTQLHILNKMEHSPLWVISTLFHSFGKFHLTFSLWFHPWPCARNGVAESASQPCLINIPRQFKICVCVLWT